MIPGFEVPVLILAFNRPDLTRALITRLRAVRPIHVYVALDGPRPGRAGDYERCLATRDIVASGIDWPCELKIQAAPVNQGCRLGVSGGISWFFSHVGEGIILEDDCAPHPDFYPFCESLLSRYRNDARVAMVAGVNFQEGHKRGKASYYFSKYTHIWGWATWARAWRHYDLDMTGLDEFIASPEWSRLHPNADEAGYWARILQRTKVGEIDTWDYQWNYTVWKTGGLVALPQENLVSNLGFRDDATHTLDPRAPQAGLHTAPLGDMKYPSDVKRHEAADQYTFERVFSPPRKPPQSKAAKSGSISPKESLKLQERLERTTRELTAIRQSLVWKLAGKPVFSIEKRLRRLFSRK